MGVGCLWCAVAAGATYTADFGHGPLRAEVPTLDVQGVPYLPLGALVRKWGGLADIQAVAVRLEAGGGVVSGSINDTQCSTPDARFALGYPLLRQDDDVYIAASDLPRLVSQGFGGSLNGAPPAQELPQIPPPQPAAAPAPTAMLPEEEGLLAPLSPAAPAPAATETAPLPEDPAALMATLPEVTQRPPVGIRVLVLDAGHGGTDTGTVTPEGLAEKDLTLRVARQLEAILTQDAGMKIVETRTEDRALSTAERAALASSAEGNLLISLHTGASFGPQAAGCNVFYAPPPAPDLAGSRRPNQGKSTRRDVSRESRYFAEAIATALQSASETPPRPPHEAPIRILGEAPMPAVMVEVGYLTNPAEATLLAQEAYVNRIAQGIAAGLKAALAAAPGTAGAQP